MDVCDLPPLYGYNNPSHPDAAPPLGHPWVGVTRSVFITPGLSDADVERIAKRVVELLKATP